MARAQRLGGFKVLRNLCRFSIFRPEQFPDYGVGFLHLLAEKKINICFITFAFNETFSGAHILLDKGESDSRCHEVAGLLRGAFASDIISYHDDVIFSLFPHRRDFGVPEKLFRIFSSKPLKPIALASSPSTISVVIREELLDQITSALFDQFVFGPYRSPSDWKLAQKGKERLYKEVVASYQEKRPKTYGIEVESANECLVLKVQEKNLKDLHTFFSHFASRGIPLSFIASVPGNDSGCESLVVSLSGSCKGNIASEILVNTEGILEATLGPVSILSMTGPHFGDRYGIASQLLMALKEQHIEPIALSCTVASISCLLKPGYEPDAIKGLRQRFEIPVIIDKNP